MNTVEKKFVSTTSSHCKVGKITPKSESTTDSSNSDTIQMWFMTDAFKKSNDLFTQRKRCL